MTKNGDHEDTTLIDSAALESEPGLEQGTRIGVFCE